MHVHSVWYLLEDASADEVLKLDEEDAGAGPFGTWERVDGGLLREGRITAELNEPDAEWTSPSTQATVASYVLDGEKVKDRFGGILLGAASPLTTASAAAARRRLDAWARHRDLPAEQVGSALRTELTSSDALDAAVLAYRYAADDGLHLVTLTSPAHLGSLPSPPGPAFSFHPEPPGLTGVTLQVGPSLVTVFDDNQVYVSAVSPRDVPALITRVGTAIWRRPDGPVHLDRQQELRPLGH